MTIIPRGNYGGATFSLPEKDRSNYSKKWCIATMKVLFGGRIAEEMFCGDVNTGAMQDIRQATSIARRMVREWGMNDRLGFIFYGDDDSKPGMFGEFGGGREYSEETQRAIDEEVKKMIDALYDETHKLLEANRERVDALAKALVKYETLDSAGRRPHHARRQPHKADGQRPARKRAEQPPRNDNPAGRRRDATGCATGAWWWSSSRAGMNGFQKRFESARTLLAGSLASRERPASGPAKKCAREITSPASLDS